MRIQIFLFSISLFIFFKVQAQVDFVLSNTVCAGDTISLVATSGTFNATSYSWTANPSGPWFASSTANHTDLMFPASGIYTISVDGFSGSTVSSASHVIVVYAQPVITISSSHSLMCGGDGATLTAMGASSYAWEPQAVVSALSTNQVYTSLFFTTNFTVTGSNNLGCTNTAYFTQQVVPYPNLQVNATSSVVCPGLTATLSALGAGTYTWEGGSLGAGVIQSSVAVGAGMYTVVGSNGGQCKDTASFSIVMGLPLSINASQDRIVRCIKDTLEEPGISFFASGASSYTWEPYDPAQMTYSIGSSTYVTPTINTCYTVTGYGFSCKGIAILCVQVSECTGIENNVQENEILLFPNPASDLVYLRCPQLADLSLRILDLSGRIVFSKGHQMIAEENTELDIRDLPAGLYFAFISWKNGTKTIRLIKE